MESINVRITVFEELFVIGIKEYQIKSGIEPMEDEYLAC
jgi:hypothetical protein